MDLGTVVILAAAPKGQAISELPRGMSNAATSPPVGMGRYENTDPSSLHRLLDHQSLVDREYAVSHGTHTFCVEVVGDSFIDVDKICVTTIR